MSYQGNTPAEKYQTLQKQSFTTSATDTFTLDYAVTNPQDLALFINNVRQNPNDAYTVSNTTLTLSSAITSSDTMYAVFLGRAVESVAPAVGSVTNDMLSGSIANDKLANSSITLNGSAVSLGGSATTVTNKPSFYADTNGNIDISNGSFTDVIFNRTRFDTNSGFNTSNGKYTIPTGEGGKYYFGCGLQWTAGVDTLHIRFGLNDGNPYSGYDGYADFGAVSNLKFGFRAIIIDCTEGQTVNVKTYHQTGATRTLYTSRCMFFGYKLFS